MNRLRVWIRLARKVGERCFWARGLYEEADDCCKLATEVMSFIKSITQRFKVSKSQLVVPSQRNNVESWTDRPSCRLFI